MDDFNAGNVSNRRFVKRQRHSASNIRQNHAGMHHAGQFNVTDVIHCAHHLACNVTTRRRCADHLIFGHRLGLALAAHKQSIADLLVPFQLRIEIASTNQLAVRDLLGGVGFGADHAICDAQLIGRHIEGLSGHLHQLIAGLSRSALNGNAALLNAG